ncbi:PASTA domain-containing protein [Streptomyces sp. GXMU-J15]|uniref:PASTA domain-containing protein n=1 Tax=Streptomyces fuscus TaxID=3048495 RepID=A0ABT7ISX8_9ACTN|nr:PASTA domain-containing protein [Streptomyces fuscus]MDL2075192.1 PASTA domain-containing protein [Streptomyces fuscus]
MNPYNTPPVSCPWWRTTPAVLGLLVLIALFGTFSYTLGFFVMIAAVVAVWVVAPWRKRAKLGATLGALVLLTIGGEVGARLDHDPAPTTDAKSADPSRVSTDAASPSPLADFAGQPLHRAEERARSASYRAGHHDAAEDGRTIFMRSLWTVCFQKADTATKTVDFAAVRTGEPCPAKDGAPLPWPKMPDVVGATYDAAVEELEQADIDLDSVTLDDVYLDVDAPSVDEAAENGDEWRVCFQSPDEGTSVPSDTIVHLDLGRWTDADLVQRCPSQKDTTYKIPANDPDYADDNGDSSANADSGSRIGGGGSTDGDSSSSGGSEGGSAGTVHPGAFCSPSGATGTSRTGKPMVCGPGSDGRDRWRSA